MNAGSSKSCKQTRQSGREFVSVLCGSELWIKGKDEKPQASASNSATIQKFNRLEKMGLHACEGEYANLEVANVALKFTKSNFRANSREFKFWLANLLNKINFTVKC